MTSNFPYYKPQAYSYASFNLQSLKFTNYPVFVQPTPPASEEPAIGEEEPDGEFEAEQQLEDEPVVPADNDEGNCAARYARITILTYQAGEDIAEAEEQAVPDEPPETWDDAEANDDDPATETGEEPPAAVDDGNEPAAVVEGAQESIAEEPPAEDSNAAESSIEAAEEPPSTEEAVDTQSQELDGADAAADTNEPVAEETHVDGDEETQPEVDSALPVEDDVGKAEDVVEDQSAEAADPPADPAPSEDSVVVVEDAAPVGYLILQSISGTILTSNRRKLLR